jgi:hypothetical protein
LRRECLDRNAYLLPLTSYLVQIYIELDGNKMLDTVAPLAVKRGEGDKVALEIQMAMEEAQLFHQANETMQR